jgi:putative phage-type endonuclease
MTQTATAIEYPTGSSGLWSPWVERELVQKSSEWLAWRQQGLGGSDAPVIWWGKHFGRTRHSLWLEKLGRGARQRGNSAMARGVRLESTGVRRWELLTGLTLRTLCVERTDRPWLRASLDGWCDERQLVAEIKAPNREDHLEALWGQVPRKYQPQLDHLVLACSASLGHYVSYSDYFERTEQVAVVPWPRHEARLQGLLRAEEQFWHCVTQEVSPLELEWNFDQEALAPEPPASVQATR